ncbi:MULTISPECIES: translation initiation factor IF-2 [unclassified Streptomyces]|uniref:translation initiation factor IF-2 n=1 Tax=unclassified Streptomyces TaxID=2593676 RepID=UPI00131A984E|nr:translation initiation factor IF-2 [Streptomyces sp. CB01635]
MPRDFTDPFEGMSHEAMLEWLDKANSGSVQAAAEKLKAAAKEIHSIAEDLKVRPQWVKWKGEGAEAFRTWSGDLANSTLALGDFSHDSSTWLTRASEAIGTAQASIPRDKAGAKANLDAATAAHNDPDAAAVASKSSSELQAIAANKEKVRQEAAGEMRKLGQAYSLSSTQMDSLPRPKFPPPPQAFVPASSKHESYSSQYGATAGQATGATGSVPSATGHASATSDASPVPRGSVTPTQAVPSIDERPTHMGIDSVGTLPEVSPPVTALGQSQHGPSVTGPTSTPPPVIGPVSPAYGTSRGPLTGRGPGPTARGIAPMGNAKGTVRPGGLPVENATGRPSTPGGRGPMMPGQNAPSTGRTGTPGGRLPTSNGVAGGRPQPVTGQPSKGIPRGKVMGTEGVPNSRGTAGGQGPTGARPTTMGASGSPRGESQGRRVAGATGEKGGIVGGRPQQQGRANSHSFSSGGSGLVRGQGSSAGASPEETNRTGQAGRGGVTPQGTHPDGRRDKETGERPDYLVEGEETWQPDTRRNVPPVVDGTSENSER